MLMGRSKLYKQRMSQQKKSEGFVENNISYVLSTTYCQQESLKLGSVMDCLTTYYA